MTFLSSGQPIQSLDTVSRATLHHNHQPAGELSRGDIQSTVGLQLVNVVCLIFGGCPLELCLGRVCMCLRVCALPTASYMPRSDRIPVTQTQSLWCFRSAAPHRTMRPTEMSRFSFSLKFRRYSYLMIVWQREA